MNDIRFLSFLGRIFQTLQKLPQSLDSGYERFFGALLVIDNLYVLEYFVRFSVDDVDFGVESVFDLVN